MGNRLWAIVSTLSVYLGWSGWAVRGPAWRRTDLNCENGCRCADLPVFLRGAAAKSKTPNSSTDAIASG